MSFKSKVQIIFLFSVFIAFSLAILIPLLTYKYDFTEEFVIEYENEKFIELNFDLDDIDFELKEFKYAGSFNAADSLHVLIERTNSILGFKETVGLKGYLDTLTSLSLAPNENVYIGIKKEFESILRHHNEEYDKVKYKAKVKFNNPYKKGLRQMFYRVYILNDLGVEVVYSWDISYEEYKKL